MKTNKIYTLFILSIFSAHLAHAQFTVNVTSYGATIDALPDPLKATAQGQVDAMFDTLETLVNAQLSDIPDTTSILKCTANSTIIAGSGIGFDYASKWGLFLVGYQIGGGFDPGTNSISDLLGGSYDASEFKGAGVQNAITLGIPVSLFTKASIGPIHLERMKAYINFMKAGYDLDTISTDFMTFGVGLQYKLIPEIGLGMGLVRWGGVDLSAGLKLASMTLTSTQTGLSVSGQSTTVNGLGTITPTYTGDVNVGVDVFATTIPLEASTSARLLYFLALYTGLATDLSMGSSKSVSTSEGVISTSGNTGITADAAVDLGQNSGPSFMNLRYFAGLQLDFTVLGVYAQITDSLTNSTKAVSLGVKAYW